MPSERATAAELFGFSGARAATLLAQVAGLMVAGLLDVGAARACGTGTGRERASCEANWGSGQLRRELVVSGESEFVIVFVGARATPLASRQTHTHIV